MTEIQNEILVAISTAQEKYKNQREKDIENCYIKTQKLFAHDKDEEYKEKMRKMKKDFVEAVIQNIPNLLKNANPNQYYVLITSMGIDCSQHGYFDYKNGFIYRQYSSDVEGLLYRKLQELQLPILFVKNKRNGEYYLTILLDEKRRHEQY